MHTEILHNRKQIACMLNQKDENNSMHAAPCMCAVINITICMFILKWQASVCVFTYAQTVYCKVAAPVATE